MKPPPLRAFIDTSILQIIVKYGEFIWGGGLEPEDEKFYQRINALQDLDDLRFICNIAQRWGFPWLITESSLEEVFACGRYDFSYVVELYDWSLENFPYPEDARPGVVNRAHQLFTKSLAGRLGKGDQQLLRDAVMNECDVFLTWELKLPKLSKEIYEKTGLHVCTPSSYYQLLKPYAALYC